jgi:hypothetical protein
MPPHSRDRPALEPASPGDTTPGRDRGWRDGNRHRWLFLFGDGRWHPVTVRAWWRDDLGRLVVQIEWWDPSPVNMGTRSGEFIADRERMREG